MSPQNLESTSDRRCDCSPLGRLLVNGHCHHLSAVDACGEPIQVLGGLSSHRLCKGRRILQQVKKVGHIISPGSHKLNIWGIIVGYRISDDDDGHKRTLCRWLRTGSPSHWLTCHSFHQPLMGFSCSKALMTIMH